MKYLDLNSKQTLRLEELRSLLSSVLPADAAETAQFPMASYICLDCNLGCSITCINGCKGSCSGGCKASCGTACRTDCGTTCMVTCNKTNGQ